MGIRIGPFKLATQPDPAFLFLTAIGLWLLWPVPWQGMPLSADHTVHLARAWMWSQELAQGNLHNWSPNWYAGFPLGELYPPLIDIAVLAIKVASLNLLSWAHAYGFAFALGFLLQGWTTLWISRRLGLGSLPGVIAGTLLLIDPGFNREGGWMYTVEFGVWAQVVATALVGWGFALLVGEGDGLSTSNDDPNSKQVFQKQIKRVLGAGLCFGCALLAHPMSLLTLVMGGSIFLAVYAVDGWNDSRSKADLKSRFLHLSAAGLIAFALSAWWLVPMWQHKEWMASLGWTFASLKTMMHWVLEGHFAQRMPSTVGYAIALGILGIAIKGKAFARFVAAFALVQWIFASKDPLFHLRLDYLSDGFTHLQYQRFIIGAKPGLYLCAGLILSFPIHLAQVLIWPNRFGSAKQPSLRRKQVGIGFGVVGLIAVGSLLPQSVQHHQEYKVGEIQVLPLKESIDFAADYLRFQNWARERWDKHLEKSEADYRIAFRDNRNTHWFMDSILRTHTPLYKIGYTPGENFVHKLESGKGQVLDALGVRYLVRLSKSSSPLRNEIARFGQIRVIEREVEKLKQIAWLEGPGQLEILDGDIRDGELSVKVTGLQAEQPTRLIFGVAGYSRFVLTKNGEESEWFEQAIFNPDRNTRPATASVDQRKQGELRGGKAKGDDGSEPIFIATDLEGHSSSEQELTIELRYRAHTPSDWVARILSIFAWLLLILVFTHKQVRTIVETASAYTALRIRPFLRPVTVLSALLVICVGVGSKWVQAAKKESSTAFAYLEKPDENHVQKQGYAKSGLLKADMLIRPAVLLSRKKSKITFQQMNLPSILRGWIAMDDDEAAYKQAGEGGHYKVTLKIRSHSESGSQGEWETLETFQVPHRPGRHMIELDLEPWSNTTVDLQIESLGQGKRPPRLGFDFDFRSNGAQR